MITCIFVGETDVHTDYFSVFLARLFRDLLTVFPRFIRVLFFTFLPVKVLFSYFQSYDEIGAGSAIIQITVQM